MTFPEKLWRKSSRCDSGACVEVAILDDSVAMRGTADPGLQIYFSREEWKAFIQYIKETHSSN